MRQKILCSVVTEFMTTEHFLQTNRGKNLSKFYISVYLYFCASIFIDMYMSASHELVYSSLIPL